jgi:hypothetical protein
MSEFIIGETIQGTLLETCKDEGISRPRVRVLWEQIPNDWRVEFPRKIREEYLIGSRFRADLKVCQKHNSDGTPKGQPYLRADTKTIKHIKDYIPSTTIKAVSRKGSADGRVYDYLGLDNHISLLTQLRKEALLVEPKARATQNTSTQYSRDEKIKNYVRQRAAGICECCQNPAPFVSRSGLPYLEVHHVHSLGDGGEDSIFNTVAVCPNCHAEVTVGVNADDINMRLLVKLKKIEKI